MEMRERREAIDGVPHRWLERDGGDVAVVLVHGIPTSPELWRHVAPLIRPDARVLAWELVGFGRSWDVPEQLDISVAAQAPYLLAWLDELQVERAVLVGHDIGGGVVQVAAVHARERCAGLVLANAVSYDSWPVPEVKVMRASGPLLGHMPRPLLRAQLSVLFGQGHETGAQAEEATDAHWPGYDHDGGAATLLRQMRALDCADTEAVAPRLPGLGVPAAVVWGAADRFQKLEPYGRRLASDLGATLDEIEEGLHFVPEDHPERVAAAIDRVVAAATAG